MHQDPFRCLRTIPTETGEKQFFHLPAFARETGVDITRLPRSLRILVESLLRHIDGFQVSPEDVLRLARREGTGTQEIPFHPGRVVLQDFTGVPAIVDLAALRSAMDRMGGDPSRINPLVPVDLVIDHSVQVDYYGDSDALRKNLEMEYRRNQERYSFLKWGQGAFRNLGIVPPGTGIVHQVNLEYLANLVLEREGLLFPDTLVGTDSHTTMINGLGVLGWGVGGIEAEAAMLGQPVYMLVPRVVGFRLTGKLKEGSSATDLVLRVTQMLRKHGVVGAFVEFFGEGLDHLTLPDRATIANMAPEYGATIGYFPVDEEVLRYLRFTGRSPALVDTVERYYREQGLFVDSQSVDPEYDEILSLDLSDVQPSLAGPKRPQDRVDLSKLKEAFAASLRAPTQERGFALGEEEAGRTLSLRHETQPGQTATESTMGHGSVVIAAITSCTNTSNPDVLIAAGLLAKRAVELGLRVPPFVKTSLAPGSRVVTDYLDKAGLSDYLDRLGFETVGYGCTTCIGNSGPLPDAVAKAVQEGDLVAAAVLSGNRNFEGRINPLVKANYLASPPLVVAYAIAGTVAIDLTTEPLGKSNNGRDIFLRDIWPDSREVERIIHDVITPEMFSKRYANVREGDDLWQNIPAPAGLLYKWEEHSTYIQEPPFFFRMSEKPEPLKEITGARVLAKLGDSVTTDHISPAGSIAGDSPAARYLIGKGVQKFDFNSYGSRRGNDRVMTRGTFANIRLRNLLAPGTEGGWTRHIPSGETMTIFDASERYIREGTPLIILAGTEYGTGSSRDWAAKGTYLLGVRAVIASSFERIHRSNLVGMGVLPLQFLPGESHESLRLTGEESYSIEGIAEGLSPGGHLTVRADQKEFQVVCRLDTKVDLEYYRSGGILQKVLRDFLGR